MTSTAFAGSSSHANFFYAREDAKLYDRTIRLTDRAYDLIHEIVPDLLKMWMSRNGLGNLASGGVIVDIGCGTGMEGMRLLEAFPNHSLFCIDSSPEMIDEFRRKVTGVYGNNSADGRVTFAQADV